MSQPTTIDRLGIHDSVSAIFPPSVLVDFLGEQVTAVDVDVVGDDEITDYRAVVTFEHRDDFADLEWVHTILAGYDRYPLDTFERRGVTLTNSTGIHGRSVGETVAGYLLQFARRLHRHRDRQGERAWVQPDWDEAFTLDGKRLCVVGTGTLGRGIASVAGPLGLSVTGVRRSPEPVPGFDEVVTTGALHDAIADADFVAAAVPLTDETRGMFGADEFEVMDNSARFVNVARGGIVEQDALVRALRTGAIAGAALDAFETEPLPEDSPLWNMDEVIVTPHAAAFTRTYYRDVGEIIARNVERLRAGEELKNRVV